MQERTEQNGDPSHIKVTNDIMRNRHLIFISLFFLSTFQVGAMSWRKYQRIEPDVYQNKMVITLHYDLQGQTIELPANTVVEFQGGSIRNGIIKGNNTKLENLQSDCLLCSFEGSFKDMDVNADVFGLHPKGDGTVKRTPNQQEAFYRLNALLPCVESLTLHFEPGYYGFGGGGNTPQGSGPSSRLWFGHSAFYLYDYTNSSRLKNFEIDGGGATFLNVFPYYIGAWTRNGKGKMEIYKHWREEDTIEEHFKHATEAGGFVYVRTKDDIDFNLHDFTVDMNRGIFRYGGYQYWTQSQCGLALTTNGDITIDHIISKNNVTDGVMILCQKHNGKEVFAKNVVIRNSTFQNNVRLGLSLSVGQNNVVDNCDFISNGRLELINDSYQFESPFADIDIEPIIDRPFADVVIKNCRFRETNRFSIVSAKQNIRSIIISNCTAENTQPGWTYGKEKNKQGKEILSIVETSTVPRFVYAHAVDRLFVEQVNLTDLCFGNAQIHYVPGDEDKGVEGQLFVTSPVKKRATVRGLRLYSGNTYTPKTVSKRSNSKDRIVNLLSLTSSLCNYKYSAGQWIEVQTSPNGLGYGGCDFEDVVYDVKDGYGIKGTAGWEKWLVQVSSLTVNVMERRSSMPIFDFPTELGPNERNKQQYGVWVKQLTINDMINGFNTDVEESPLIRVVHTTIRR